MSLDLTPLALVADDDPIVRMNAVSIVEAAGFRVIEAAGADQAHEILAVHHNTIQLLLTDVQMPPGKLNGFDLARACADRWPAIRILVASGMIRPAAGEMPENAKFIEKPFSDDVILEYLQGHTPSGR